MVVLVLNVCGVQVEVWLLLWWFVCGYVQYDGFVVYMLMCWLVEQGDDDGLCQLVDFYCGSVLVFVYWCEVQCVCCVFDWFVLEQVV